MRRRSPRPSPSPTPTATPTTPDSIDVDHTVPEKRVSRWWRFTVATASEFTVEFTVTDGCLLDVFVLVFHERCDPDRSVEFEFTAEIGAGEFDD